MVAPYTNKKCCSFTGLNVSTLDYCKSICTFCQWEKKKWFELTQVKTCWHNCCPKSFPHRLAPAAGAFPRHVPGQRGTRQSLWLSRTTQLQSSLLGSVLPLWFNLYTGSLSFIFVGTKGSPTTAKLFSVQLLGGCQQGTYSISLRQTR